MQLEVRRAGVKLVGSRPSSSCHGHPCYLWRSQQAFTGLCQRPMKRHASSQGVTCVNAIDAILCHVILSSGGTDQVTAFHHQAVPAFCTYLLLLYSTSALQPVGLPLHHQSCSIAIYSSEDPHGHHPAPPIVACGCRVDCKLHVPGAHLHQQATFAS